MQVAKKTHPRTEVRLERKSVELHRDADRNDTKGFYSGLKEVWGPNKKGPVHLKSTDGMETFSDSKRVVARWTEHFQKLLNVPGDTDHEALDNIPQRITKTSFDEIATMDEMGRAIAGLKNSKGDGIPADVWKHNLFSRLHENESPMHKRWVLYYKHGRMPAL